MASISRKYRWLMGAVVMGVLIGFVLSAKHWLFDNSGKPVCHKQLDSLFHHWRDKHKTRAFPNVGGDSVESLMSVAHVQMMRNYPELKSHYSYVPGLTRDDPGDLVLLYINQPTRWTWHGPTPTVFTSKQWILVPVDMTFFGNREPTGPGEFSERVPFDEFRMRLSKTLDYIQAQKRPHWEVIVKQHSEFLDRIERGTSD